MKLLQKAKAMVCLLAAVAVLAGCTGGAAPSGGGTAAAPALAPAEYKQVIENARDPELNGLPLFTILTPEDGQAPGFDMTDFEALTEEEQQVMQRYNLHGMVFEGGLGFVEDDMEAYAISVGTIITQAYGVLVIMPKEGRHDAVLEQVNSFVEQQRKAQENYLPDQYEIAKGAVVKTADSGEVMLAMCEDAGGVMEKLEAGLKEKHA